MIEPGAPPSGPEPPELGPAYTRLMRILEDIKGGGTGGLMPTAKSLDDFFAELRARGNDDVFTSENPGP